MIGKRLANGPAPLAKDDNFLNGREKLIPADAVAALLLTTTGRYVLQLRDDKPEIFFPNHWGCFGGGLESGETRMEALRRELYEEIRLDLDRAHVEPFTEMRFDFGFAGQPAINRYFYTISIEPPVLHDLELNEGAALGAFGVDEILQELRMTPYDYFAVWMHANRKRLAKG